MHQACYGGLSRMVTWYLKVRHLIFISPPSKPRTVSQEDSVLQKRVWVCFKTVELCAILFLMVLTRDSYITPICHRPFGSHSLCPVQEQLILQSWLAAELFVALDPTQKWLPYVSLANRQEEKPHLTLSLFKLELLGEVCEPQVGIMWYCCCMLAFSTLGLDN